MAELWLIRHAETPWSRARKHTGRTDIPLTEEGREHGRRLRERLAGHDFAKVLSSPLSRARETAELAGFGDRLELRDDLMEWDYGAYEGRTTAEIRAERPDWDLWRDGCPGGEMPDDVGARADRVIAEVLDTVQSGHDVACFAHGHILRVLAARWVQERAGFGKRLVLETGAVSRLGFEREVPAITGWNV